MDHTEKLKKQSGVPGLFAQISFEIEPADQEFLDSEPFKEGKVKMQFVNDIFGGSIPKELVPPTEKGFESMMNNGVSSGF
ncbi:MAG: hypothetical protein R2771_04880 [Saprospiraceae bacterium]